MQKQAFFFPAIITILLLISPTKAALTATASTYAECDTLSDSDTDTSTTSVPAQAHTHVEYMGRYGQSDAEASITGVVKGSSEGFDSHRSPIFAYSNSSSSTDWLIDSSTLPTGTPVNVLVDVSFVGELFSDYSGFDTYANASFSVDETELYQGSGRLTQNNLTADGYWLGDFHSAYKGYALDTTDTLSFSAFVGDIMNIELTLHTEVTLPDVLAGSEAMARADFSNSGFYTFAGAKDPLNPGTMLDVNFQMVPEPATILLLGLGGLALRRKRRP